MRDFGFWVRIIAISQLFNLVLASYGDGWLAHDNPILNLGDQPESAARLQAQDSEAGAAETTKAKRPDGENGAGTWQEQYGAGWGGIEAPEMAPVAPDHPEYVRNGSLAADNSKWAEDGD
jgi:hypothetical protein